MQEEIFPSFDLEFASNTIATPHRTHLIMNQISFCIFAFVSLFIYFLGVEPCSVKSSLTPPTTKIPPKRTTPVPQPSKIIVEAASENDDESRFTKYSKYAKSGFFIEIEETMDNKTRVYQMQQLPPIYSRTTTKRATDSQNGSIPEVEQVFGAESNGEEDQTPLTEEDLAVQKDWEGDCVASNWRHCNSLKHITVMNVYNKTEGRGYKTHHLEMDCRTESIACLKNGWTVNRCQIICMSKCNSAMLQGYDSVVSHGGACKYI